MLFLLLELESASPSRRGEGGKRWWANLRRRDAGGDSEKAEMGGTGEGRRGGREAVGVGESSCGLGGPRSCVLLFSISTEPRSGGVVEVDGGPAADEQLAAPRASPGRPVQSPSGHRRVMGGRAEQGRFLPHDSWIKQAAR